MNWTAKNAYGNTYEVNATALRSRDLDGTFGPSGSTADSVVYVDDAPCEAWTHRDIVSKNAIVAFKRRHYRVRVYGSSGAAYPNAPLPRFYTRANEGR
jgi:hypothetical protein